MKLQDIVPEADALGPLREDLPVYEARKGGEVAGYVFLTSDFVTTTGYSGKPIHVVMGVDPGGKITGVRLVKHSEPIVLVGIPESAIREVIGKYTGLDLVAEAQSSGSAHDLDIVSGATVTIMVIDDSIVRAGLRVARQLGLGGLQADKASEGQRKGSLHRTWRCPGLRLADAGRRWIDPGTEARCRSGESRLCRSRRPARHCAARARRGR
ncbi:MAG: FMN-binding protein [Tepidamorphaceae bacterium]